MKNTLLIVLDDVGPPFGYSPGDTPNLYNIGRSSTVHSLWTMPNCSATRAALLTRSYPNRNGIGTIVRGDDATGLDPARLRLPYEGGRHFRGKWHLTPDWNIIDHVKACWWDSFRGHANNLGSGGQGGYWDWDLTVVDGKREGTERTTMYQPDWLRMQVADDLLNNIGPFLMCSMALIHKPWHTPPGYGHNPTDQAQAKMMLRRMDEDVGFLWELAVQQGYRVLVFSDNGAAEPLGGAKGTLYRAGIHTKLFAHGFEAPTSVLDVVDVLTLCDGQVSGDAEPITTRAWRYSEKFNPNNSAPTPDYHAWTYQERDWKLIRNPGHDDSLPEWELYRIDQDPREEVNLAPDNPQTIARLAANASQRAQ